MILLVNCARKTSPIITQSSICEGFQKIDITKNDKKIIIILDDIANNSSRIVYETTYASSVLMGPDVKFSDEFIYSIARHNAKYDHLCSAE